MRKNNFYRIDTIIIIILLLLLLASCNNIDKSNCKFLSVNSSDPSCNWSIKNNILHVETNSFSSTKVQYKFDNATPNSMYVISINIDIKHVEYNKSNPTKGVALMLDENTDYNASRSFSNMVFGETKKTTIKRVAKSDNQGVLDFYIVLGWEDNLTKISVNIKDVNVLNIVEDSEYYNICSSDSTIRLILKTKDVDNSGVDINTLKNLANIYSDIRSNIKWLVNNQEPYYGITDIVFTESIDHFAIAGNPIYVNCSDCLSVLKRINLNIDSSKNDIIWEIIHEISHTFDGIENANINGIWNFDNEFMATFKAVISISKSGYGMGGDIYIGSDIKRHFDNTPKLSSGVYSNFGFTYLLLDKINNNYKAVQDTFKAMENDANLTNIEKFDSFIYFLSKYLKMDEENILTEIERNVIINHLKFL